MPTSDKTRRWTRWLNVVFLALGLVALGWMLHRVGLHEFRDGLHQLGWAFVLSCGAHFVSIAMDSITLRACMGADAGQVTYGHVLRASLAGHAINVATPLGKLGELTKFTLLAERVDSHRAAAALIVQNLIMFVANCALMIAAPALVLASLDVDHDVSLLLSITAGVFAIFGVVTVLFLYVGLGDVPFRLARRLGVHHERVDRWRSRWRSVEVYWREAARDRRAMITACASGLASRVFSVAEIAVLLVFLHDQHVIAVAALALAGSQMISWLTGFVPMQTGTAEGGAYLLFRSVGQPAGVGVIVELVRKARFLVFIGIGVALLGWQTFRTMRRGDRD